MNPVFFAFNFGKNVLNQSGSRTRPENPKFGQQNINRVTNRPANPDFWVTNLNRWKRAIQPILRFSTTIQAATTNFRFRRLSGTARGGEIANSDDPTSWIASLSTLVQTERTAHENARMLCLYSPNIQQRTKRLLLFTERSTGRVIKKASSRKKYSYELAQWEFFSLNIQVLVPIFLKLNNIRISRGKGQRLRMKCGESKLNWNLFIHIYVHQINK